MSMYTVCGRVFVTRDELYHGLGKGSGRGRPKGSRNGYIDPRAAYMKGYEIKGEKAQTTSTPGISANLNASKQRSGLASRPENRTSVTVTPRARATGRSPVTATSRPGAGRATSATQRGRDLINRLDQKASMEPTQARYNMRSDPYSGVGAAENEPDGYNMHSDPYENVQGTAAENTQNESFWQTLGRAMQGIAGRARNMAVRAIENTKYAYRRARDWVSNAVSEVGRFAKTAYDTASRWVGDRARDLDRWWNGYDTVASDSRIQNDTNPNTRSETVHTPGARERITNAGRAIGDAARQAGETANRAILGADMPIRPGLNVQDDVQPTPIDTAHVNSMFEAAGNGARQLANQGANWANQNVVQPVVGAARQAGNAISNAYDTASTAVNNAVINPVSDWAYNTAQGINADYIQPAVQQAGQLWNQTVAQPTQQALATRQNVLNSSYAQTALMKGASPASVEFIADQYALGMISEADAIDRLRNLNGSPAW